MFQPPDQCAADPVHIDAVKMIGTEFSIVLFAFEHVKSDNQERMGHSHNCTLGSPPRGNAAIQSREIVVLHHRDGPGCLRQTTPQRHIALAHLAAQSFPGTLKTSWTQTSPGS